MRKEFAVIGLGRFGGSICKALSEEGLEVMAMDIDEDKVNEYAKIASHAVIGDSTDESVLKNLGLRNFDHVIVAIGENIQASILTTLILKELGVNTITVKAQNDYHEKVLAKIGADHIVHPERDMAKRIAHNIVSNNVLDYLSCPTNTALWRSWPTAGLRATHCLIWTSGRSTALISWPSREKRSDRISAGD